jgi:hypothetical protein
MHHGDFATPDNHGHGYKTVSVYRSYHAIRSRAELLACWSAYHSIPPSSDVRAEADVVAGIFIARVASGSFMFLRLKMDPQPDDQAEIVRLGFNKVLANLGIGDAIPDAGNIEREAFVEVN